MDAGPGVRPAPRFSVKESAEASRRSIDHLRFSGLMSSTSSFSATSSGMEVALRTSWSPRTYRKREPSGPGNSLRPFAATPLYSASFMASVSFGLRRVVRMRVSLICSAIPSSGKKKPVERRRAAQRYMASAAAKVEKPIWVPFSTVIVASLMPARMMRSINSMGSMSAARPAKVKGPLSAATSFSRNSRRVPGAGRAAPPWVRRPRMLMRRPP